MATIFDRYLEQEQSATAPPAPAPAPSATEPRPPAPPAPPAPPLESTGTIFDRYLREEVTGKPSDPDAEYRREAWDQLVSEGFIEPSKGEAHTSSYMEALLRDRVRPISDFGLLGQILDVVSRPEYAAASVANYLSKHAQPDPASASDFISAAAPYQSADIQALLDVAWGGMTGKNKYAWDNFVRDHYPGGKWKHMALSLTLAIALDPTNLLPLGTAMKGIGRAARAGTRQLRRSEKLAELERKARSRFLPREYREYKAERHAETEFMKDEVLRQAARLREGTSKADRELMTFLRQHPDEPVPAHLRAKMDEIDRTYNDIVEDLYHSGRINETQYIEWTKERPRPYSPGMYEHTRFLTGELPARWITQKPFWLKAKKFDTAEDAKKLADDFTSLANSPTPEVFDQRLAALSDRIDSSIFRADETLFASPEEAFKAKRLHAAAYAKHYTPIEDAVELLAMRALDHEIYKARMDFTDQVLERWGKYVPGPAGVPPPGYGYYFPRGRIRFFAREVIDPKFRTDLKRIIDSLRDQISRTAAQTTTEETVKRADETILRSTKRTTTRTIPGTVPGEAATLAESGPLAKLEDRLREALMHRGFSKGEADASILKVKGAGPGRGTEEIIEEISEDVVQRTEDIIERAIREEKFEGELIPAHILDRYTTTMPSITKRVRKYLLPDVIARDMNRTARGFVGDPLTRGVLKTIDRIQNAWKVLATSMRPKFHLRNLYSNIWLAFEGGLHNPLRYAEASRLQISIGEMLLGKGRLAADAAARTWKIGNTTYTTRQLYDLAGKLGVRGRGWIGSDVQLDAVKELDQILRYGKLRHLSPPRIGRAVGTVVEDNARLALFLDQLHKGAVPKAAAAHVRKHLFDYQELTPFEKSTLRRIWPFWTWKRKNTMLQLEKIFTETKKFGLYADWTRARQAPESVEERTMRPEYFDSLVYVKTGDYKFAPPRDRANARNPFPGEFSVTREQYASLPASQRMLFAPLYSGLDLPPIEFNRLVSYGDLLSGISPFKALVETGLNTVLFPEIKKMRYDFHAWTDMMPAPFWVQFIIKSDYEKLRKMRLVAPISNTWGISQESQPDVVPPGMILGANKVFIHLMHSAFPMLNELSRAYATPLTISDVRPDVQKRNYWTGVSNAVLQRDVEASRLHSEYVTALERIQHLALQQPLDVDVRREIAKIPEERIRRLLAQELEPLIRDEERREGTLKK